MQRVVRSTLVGLLTIAGLAACGDSVTTTSPVTQTPGTVVHGVTVTPSSVSLNVGQSITLAASVDADAGVAARTVTWSSSDATVASVGTDGKVTGIKAGTVTITAASTADATVKGAAVVTVGAGGAGAVPTVSISSVNTVTCAGPVGTAAQGICQSVPANLSNFGTANGGTGQLDITLNVDSQGQPLKSVTATLKCGTESISSTQTISSNTAPISAEAAAAPVTISLNTAGLKPDGVTPLIHNNGNCQIIASATTNSATPQTATTSTNLTLNNANTVAITSSFDGGTQTDANGQSWKAGNLTVSATPILYSNVAPISVVTISIPNPLPAPGNPQTFKVKRVTTSTNGVFSVTFPNNVFAAGGNVGAQTIFGPPDAAGLKGLVTPLVIASDSAGNDVPLVAANAASQTASFRLDNEAPFITTTAMIPTRQQGWVNGSYLFAGVGGFPGSSRAVLGRTNYVSSGDRGVSNVLAVSGTTGNNGQTTFQYFVKAASAYSPTNDQLQDPFTGGFGTSFDSPTSKYGQCPTTANGYTQVNSAGDLAATTNNQAYVVRILELDKLGNVRCTDAGTGINTGNFVVQKFGVDKVAPTASFIGSGTDPLALDDKVQYSCYTNGVPQPMAPGGTCALNNNKMIKVALSDDASGFNSSPLLTTVTRLAVNNAQNGTGVTSTPSDANAFSCPLVRAGNPDGFDLSGGCPALSTPSNLNADVTVTTVDAFGNPTGFASSGIDGYYTFTTQALDLARNASTTITRQVVVDRQAPVVGGVAVPATINGGQSTNFATSATDNLDLVAADNSLAYNVTPSGSAQPLSIRSSQQAIGVAFDNVLTTAASFSMNVPFFIRDVQQTNAAGNPTGVTGTPQSITIRAYDAGGNSAAGAPAAISAANISQTNPQTNYSTIQPNPNPGQPGGSQLSNFVVSNAATNVSNCPAAGCAGSAAPANATTVQLTATVSGNNSSAGGNTYQFQQPFSQVQFYYQDPTTGEYFFIGSTTAPTVSDTPTGATTSTRTFSYTLSQQFKPPVSLGTGALRVIAVGVNANGDGLVTPVNTAITLTNP